MDRLIRLIFFPLVMVAMTVLWSAGYSFRRKEEDQELLLLAEEAALSAPEENEGDHDDRQRRGIFDIPLDARVDQVHRAFLQQEMEILPVVPFQDWVYERKLARERTARR